MSPSSPRRSYALIANAVDYYQTVLEDLKETSHVKTLNRAWLTIKAWHEGASNHGT